MISSDHVSVRTEYLTCSCGTDGLQLMYDPVYDALEIGIFEVAPHDMTFWQKLRLVWQILWKGKPYGDQVILTGEGIDKFKKLLAEFTHERTSNTNGNEGVSSSPGNAA